MNEFIYKYSIVSVKILKNFTCKLYVKILIYFALITIFESFVSLIPILS